MASILISIFGGLVCFLYSRELFAWGPAAHLKLGLAVIDNLKILGGDVANIISNNPLQFLYGCISADIIQGKRFIKYIYNCHNWDNAFKLLRSAKSQPLKSFAYGYLSHLSADIVAHNCFVPSKMIETYCKRGLKHFLWEMRFDSAVYDLKLDDLIKEISKMDHTLEDELMNGLFRTAIFSFKTNKRIFSSLLFVQRIRRWQGLLNEAHTGNNYSLSREEIDYYFRLSFDAMLGFLIDSKNSRYLKYDPMGKVSLGLAKKIMKDFQSKEKMGMLEGISSTEVMQSIERFKINFLK